MAERFDEDPFLIFTLRGRTKEQIISALREKRAIAAPDSQVADTAFAQEDSSNEASLRLEDVMDTFWLAGNGLDRFTVNPEAPEVDKAVLKRLGDAPFEVGGKNLTVLLGKAYDIVSGAAMGVEKEIGE